MNSGVRFWENISLVVSTRNSEIGLPTQFHLPIELYRK